MECRNKSMMSKRSFLEDLEFLTSDLLRRLVFWFALLQIFLVWVATVEHLLNVTWFIAYIYITGHGNSELFVRFLSVSGCSVEAPAPLPSRAGRIRNNGTFLG